MSATAYERVGLALANDARKPGGTSSWIVTGTLDATEATTAVLTEAPATATLTVPLGAGTVEGTLYRQRAAVRELGRGVWEATVEYGLTDAFDLAQTVPPPPGPPPPPAPGPADHDPDTELGPEWQFDTTGGTEKVTVSEATRYGRPRGYGPDAGGLPGTGVFGAPNFKGLIGVGDDKVEGCERFVGKLEWSVTCKRVNVTPNYLRTLAELTGTLNEEGFASRDAEELLFLGASGGFRPGDGWTVTFKFAEGDTLVDETIPPLPPAVPPVAPGYYDNVILFPVVRPFDHVWFKYEAVTESVTLPGGAVQTVTVSRPKFGYVERVYRVADFTLLGIGG